MFPRVLLFLSTPSARRATRRCCSRRHCGQYFYPRPLRGGRRGGLAAFNLQAAISIHALREEGDGSSSKGNGKACKFLSTPSARRATSPIPTWRICDHISIHALREEGDPGHGDKSGAVRNFYPRPPRGGRLLIAHPPCTYLTFLSTPSARRATRGTSMKAATKTLFLSTPSARRATGAARAAERSRQYFYPRPPRGGRPQRTAGRKQRGDFYPRPPRGGRREGKLTAYTRGEFLSTPSARRATSIRSMCCSPGAYFYPRPPRGGRRFCLGHPLAPPAISIHALREEGDSTSIAATTRLGDFYPRPPRGGRQACIFTRTITSLFLSTPSARRATFYRPGRYLPGMISIHALREEGDSVLSLNFDFFDISIHALREEGDS